MDGTGTRGLTSAHGRGRGPEAELEASRNKDTDTLFDIVGVGFGPSNLALAVCAREMGTRKSMLFLERADRFKWHPGMLIDGARMQISFLKDLVSLRNPASPFTFLQYLKAKGRLEKFVNLGRFRPTRIEYDDYLRWVAEHFAKQVRYGAEVIGVVPGTRKANGRTCDLRISFRDAEYGCVRQVRAKNIVYAAGGEPRWPEIQGPGACVIHANDFIPDFERTFPAYHSKYTFMVIGGGQSAGEIVAYLLENYGNAKVHVVTPGATLRPTDNSPFVNEQFFSENVDAFYNLNREARQRQLRELRNANYGVIREDLIERIYDLVYADDVRGMQRLVLHAFSRLQTVQCTEADSLATIGNLADGTRSYVSCDGVVLTTGYERRLETGVLRGVAEYLEKDGAGDFSIGRKCRARTVDEFRAGVYVQGYLESRLGLGDTLLSMLPFRSRDIFDDICNHDLEGDVQGPSGLRETGGVKDG